MEKFVIHGGKPLVGEVEISGAKNAAVAILPATILAGGKCVIENLPNISDVSASVDILSAMGAHVRVINKHTLEIDTAHITATSVPNELSRQMRASYYFLGALLGRFGKATVAMPGGCNLGPRPIDQHLKAFVALGAKDSVEYGMISVESDSLRGEDVFFDTVSVGATINAMLAAVMAEGQTVLENVAKEPHIVDVANFLNMMGADVRGAGTDVIKIRPITSKLEKAGATIEEFDDSLRVYRTGDLEPLNIKTMPHPGFPTDMQPLMTVLLTLAKGTSIITEGIWENRFRYVDELTRMGANIQVDGRVAVIEGVQELLPAPMRAADLRAGAALVVAALAADGVSEVDEICHIERGYEDIVEKLRGLGADIKRVEKPAGVLRQAAL